MGRRENIKLKTDSDINTDEIGGHMIRVEKQWDAGSEFTTRVLKKKMNERKTSKRDTWERCGKGYQPFLPRNTTAIPRE